MAARNTFELVQEYFQSFLGCRHDFWIVMEKVCSHG